MNTLMCVSSGVRALVALLLLSVSAHSTELCGDNGAENCDKWTKTSHNQPLNTGKVVISVFEYKCLRMF